MQELLTQNNFLRRVIDIQTSSGQNKNYRQNSIAVQNLKKMKSNITALVWSLTTLFIVAPSSRADTLTNSNISSITDGYTDSQGWVCWCHTSVSVSEYDRCRGLYTVSVPLKMRSKPIFHILRPNIIV